MRFLLSALFFCLTPALQAELQMTTNAGGESSSSLNRLPALFVEKGSPAAPGLAPGKFTANFKGKLVIPKRYRLNFSFTGNGAGKSAKLFQKSPSLPPSSLRLIKRLTQPTSSLRITAPSVMPPETSEPTLSPS